MQQICATQLEKYNDKTHKATYKMYTHRYIDHINTIIQLKDDIWSNRINKVDYK